MAYTNMISRSDIAARQGAIPVAKGLGKIQSSPKVSAGGNGTKSSPAQLGAMRPAFSNLK